jgi:hypothetical protein
MMTAPAAAPARSITRLRSLGLAGRDVPRRGSPPIDAMLVELLGRVQPHHAKHPMHPRRASASVAR